MVSSGPLVGQLPEVGVGTVLHQNLGDSLLGLVIQLGVRDRGDEPVPREVPSGVRLGLIANARTKPYNAAARILC